MFFIQNILFSFFHKENCRSLQGETYTGKTLDKT